MELIRNVTELMALTYLLMHLILAPYLEWTFTAHTRWCRTLCVPAQLDIDPSRCRKGRHRTWLYHTFFLTDLCPSVEWQPGSFPSISIKSFSLLYSPIEKKSEQAAASPGEFVPCVCVCVCVCVFAGFDVFDLSCISEFKYRLKMFYCHKKKLHGWKFKSVTDNIQPHLPSTVAFTSQHRCCCYHLSPQVVASFVAS